jgi:hypothetical protein
MWFSHNVLRDHGLEWLGLRMKEAVPFNEYWFYFQRRPEIFNEFAGEYDLAGASPIVKAASS